MTLSVYPDRLRRDIAAAINNAALGGKINAGYNLLKARFPVGSTLQLIRSDVIVFSVVLAQPMTIANGSLYLPQSYGSTFTLSNADIDTGTWFLKLSYGTEWVKGTVTKTGGAGPFFLTADLDTTLGFSLGAITFTLPFALDLSVGPSPTPVPAPAPPPTQSGEVTTWLSAAQTDMRKNPANFSGSYSDSYALNDATPRLRTESNPSSQAIRAQLSMGRYGTSVAFTSTNPDYQTDLSWVGSTAPERSIAQWTRIIAWDQLFQSVEGGGNGATGYIGNTRVLTFGKELWVKYNTGQWARLASTNTSSGEVWRPNFQEYGGNTLVTSGGNMDLRDELGGTSMRTTPAIGTERYWVPHLYFGLQSIDPTKVIAVLSVAKTSLVLHDSTKTDDRDASRWLYSVGADWYPPSGSFKVYVGVGTSRQKYVRAKWPAFQYHVMHTETWAGITNSYPAVS